MPGAPSALPPFEEEQPFTVQVALQLGARRTRLFGSDLEQPFAGVRMLRAPRTVLERALAYAPRMAEGEFFSHLTAAELHGMWLPRDVPRLNDALDVSVFAPGREPRDRGVRGHRSTRTGVALRSVHGLRVLGAAETWCQLGPLLSIDDLVVAADGLLTPDVADREHRLAVLRALASRSRRPGGAKLRAALELVRTRVRSPQESRLRLLVVRSGRPEPLVNHAVFDHAGRFVAEVDLGYPAYRVGLEYEGDHHRTDRRQFRKDILRREQLIDVDWWIVRVTQDDLEERPAGTLMRLDTSIARRGAA